MQYKIGDKVKIFRGHSEDSIKYNGKIGKIISVNTGSYGSYYMLDVAHNSGIWEQELTLTDKIISQVYGIVKFTNTYYK